MAPADYGGMLSPQGDHGTLNHDFKFKVADGPGVCDCRAKYALWGKANHIDRSRQCSIAVNTGGLRPTEPGSGVEKADIGSAL